MPFKQCALQLNAFAFAFIYETVFDKYSARVLCQTDKIHILIAHRTHLFAFYVLSIFVCNYFVRACTVYKHHTVYLFHFFPAMTAFFSEAVSILNTTSIQIIKKKHFDSKQKRTSFEKKASKFSA